MEVKDLVVLEVCLSLKRYCPSRFMDCLHFQTVIDITEATASFKHFRLAFCKISSERILSESFVLVMVLAVALMALLISSVTPMQDLSSFVNQIGIVTGQAARILPMRSPLAKVLNK